MKIQTYNEIDIQVLSKTPNSTQIMKLACDITQKKVSNISTTGMNDKLAKYLISADHTSIFEHSSMTILATGISRSLLAQVTRQRTFKFTSASQHYQNYSEYPMSIRPGWEDNYRVGDCYMRALDFALEKYIELIDLGEPPEEARQVLPNACAVNIVITMDPRNLANFLIKRLCKRNTLEMLTFATKLKKEAFNWIPEIFHNIHKPCLMDKCNQGAMSCKGK